MKKFIKLVAFTIICTVVSVFALTVSSAEINITELPFEENLLYGRNALKQMDNGKKLVAVYDTLFKEIHTAVTDENGYINISENSFQLLKMLDIIVYKEELETVLLPLRYDNPQLFWWDNSRACDYFYNDGEDKFITSVKIPSLYNTSTDEGKNIFNEAKTNFESAAREFIAKAGVTEKISEYEISLRLHDAIVKHVEYAYDLKGDNIYNAYGALIDGKAVCEGYAELYQYLLYLCGIQSHAVTGTADGQNHMWNLVKIDDEYYMSDPTWDDPIGNNTDRIYHEYLNVTEEKLISEGRKFEDIGYELPKCTATKANYYNHYFYNMSNFKEQPSVKNAITQLKYYGEARFHYNGNGTYTYSEFKDWCRTNIGTIINEITFKQSATQKSYSCIGLKNEYILTVTDVDTIELPVIENIPKIAAVCVDTAVTVKIGSVAGAVAVCPVVSGTTLSATDIQELLNNTAVDVKSLVEGNIATGSKLVLEDEEAVIAVKGDVDGDGILTVFDANMAQKGDIDFKSSYVQKTAADLDGNDTVDTKDAQDIVNQIVS